MPTDHRYTPHHPPHRGPIDPAQAYQAFVEELAADPDRPDLLDRLTLGHTPDPDGWCTSPGHASHWERHPCRVVRLAMLVARTPEAPLVPRVAEHAASRTA